MAARHTARRLILPAAIAAPWLLAAAWNLYDRAHHTRPWNH